MEWTWLLAKENKAFEIMVKWGMIRSLPCLAPVRYRFIGIDPNNEYLYRHYKIMLHLVTHKYRS